MNDELIREYFKRDLSEAEEDRLSAELASSEEATRAFMEEAQSYYERVVPKKAQSFRWMWVAAGFLAGVLLTMCGFCLWSPRKTCSVASVAPSAEAPRRIAAAPPPAAVAQAPQEKVQRVELAMRPAPTLQPRQVVEGVAYGKWSVVIRQATTGLVTIRILDANRQEMRVLFAGVLRPGAWVFEWDGKRSDGQRVVTGTYLIQAQSGKDVAQKSVTVD